MGILILGWSILEAVGAALMIPAIIALIAANYEGRDRVIAYGAIGGIAGAAAAARPDHRRLGGDGRQLARRLRRPRR